jgi:hypothetical protein
MHVATELLEYEEESLIFNLLSRQKNYSKVEMM